MKHKHLFYALPIATVFAVSSCRKSTETTTTVTTTADGSSPSATGPISEPEVVTNVAPLDRAAKLGFAQMLPADTETLMLFQDGKEVAKRLKTTKLWKMITEESPEMVETIEGNGDSETLKPGDILGEEFFLATGKSTAVQTGNLLKANQRINYHMTKMAVSAMLTKLTGGEEEIEAMRDSSTKMTKDMLNDPEFGAAWLQSAEMPPIYFGCKTNGESAKRVQEAFVQASAGAASVGASAEEFSFEVSGNTFKGTRISGKLLVEEGKANAPMMDSMKEQFGATTLDNLLTEASKKNIIIASGTVNGYELLLIGSRPEDFAFAATPADSLAASKALSFVDGYMDKKQVAVLYSDKSVIEKAQKAGGLGVLCDAVRDSLSGNGKMDTREIEALLGIVSERENELLGMEKPSDFGAIAMLDEGFRFETFGGTSLPSLDTKAPNKLGALGEGKDVAIFANWTSNKAYDDVVRSYLEAIVQTVYASAKSAAAMDVDDEGFKEFKQYFTMFEDGFRTDAVRLWTAMSTQMAEGLGNETALIVDLAGEMPPIPGVPQELVKDGLFPRISAISPVTDRAKLAESWTMINTTGENMMKNLSEMMDFKQAMPKPMSSQSNDLTTWFFAAPLFTDDFAPSVTLSDKWFVASTSKKHAVELAKLAETSNTGRTGAYMTVDFDALSSFGKKWLEATDKNKESLFAGNEMVAEQFEENQDNISKALDAISDLDQLDIHTRKAGDMTRSSLHFKTR